MRSYALALALAFAPLAACAPLQAAMGPATATDTNVSLDVAAAPAGAYGLDGSHTAVIWRVRHLGVSLYSARFDKVEGTLTLDPRDPTKSSVDVTVDVGSVSTGLRDNQGQLAFDKKIGEALGSVAHPKARFVSTTLTRTSPTKGVMVGDLTFNGVTKPLTLNVTFGGGRTHPFLQRYLIGFSATGNFKRSDFGVTSWAGSVGDDVQLQIDTEFVKTP